MPEIISRKEAKALGLLRYYTGKPCKRGHVVERYVSTGNCVECAKERDANSDRKAYNKAWREGNPARKKANNKAYYEANAYRYRANNKAWREANPDKNRVKSRNHRALKRSAEGSHTAQDIQNIYETQKGLCAYCRVDVGTDYHVDHIHPLSRGGSNGKENLQITCPTCNLKKGVKAHKEFLKELELQEHSEPGSLELEL